MKVTKLNHSFLDYPDNHSCAIVVTVIGCSHNCKGCQNKALQDFKYKECIKVSPQQLKSLIDDYNASKSYSFDKIVLIGGDPLHPNNIEDVNEFCKLMKSEYDICIYTGYEKDYIEYSLKEYNFKFIKTGLYKEELKQLSYKNDNEMVFASTNQRLYENRNNKLKLVTNNKAKYKYE